MFETEVEMKKYFALLLVLAVAATLFAIAGCGGESSDEGGAKAAAQAFVDATLEEDADAAYELLSKESKSGVEKKEELVEGATDYFEDFTVGESEESDGTALVNVSIKIKETGQTIDFKMALVEEDGQWLIDLERTGTEMDKAFQKLMEESSATQSSAP